MGSPIKIDTLARDLIRLSGFKPDGEIKIEYTGLRPGEKLFEELLMSEEGLSDTAIDKIFVAKPMTLSYDVLIAKIEALKAFYPDNEGLILKIKEIVPTFKTPEELNEGFEGNM